MATIKPKISDVPLEEKLKERELTDKQKRFAELVAHDIDRKRAYETAYDVAPETKQVTIDNASRRLMNNVNVLKEIDRIKELVQFTKGIDGIDPEKKVEMLDKDEVSGVATEWTQKIAFKKFSELLNGCEESLILLKERPQLFGECRQLCNDIRKVMEKDGTNNERLTDMLKNIEDTIYKLGKFDVKEYNSTVSSTVQIMKVMNDITGVGKNAKAIENENFEHKLYTLLDNMDQTAGQFASKKPKYTLIEEAENYAFEE